jgi:cyclophilin family peptidyl-prolyl cis-trans isomerase
MRLAIFLVLTIATAVDINAPDPQAVNVKCTTTKGNFSLVINPSWAPLGAARFLDMVDTGFFDRIAAYRVVPGFLVGFGVPFTTTKTWPEIKDDPNIGVQYPLFKRGMLAFAGYAANTRSTEAFIGYQDTANLGRSAWGNPFGIVTSGMEVLDKFYSGYGDLTQFGGQAPDPIRMGREGGAFLLREYPKLDYITSCARTSASSTPSSSRLATSGAGPKSPAAPIVSSPAAPVVSSPALPPCTSSFCGSGVGFAPGVTLCLCHENCLLYPTAPPCCPSFKEVCPTQYARGPAPVAATATAASAKAPAAKAAIAKATKNGKKAKIGKKVVG